MPKANVDLAYAIGLPPGEAIAYFESKGYVIGFNWHDVEARAHATQFTVAGILKQDILSDVREALVDSLSQGQTLRQFEKQLLPVLTQKGWIGRGLVADKDGVLEGKQLTPRRLKTIFETNMQASYNAGRYEEQLANAEYRPYWERIAIMDTHTRPRHAALNSFTARYDDPVWQFMYPPDGYGCRCRVRARSLADIKQNNIQVQSSEGRIETVVQAWGPNDTREVQALRINGELYTPDAGFGHNPGQGYLASLGQRLMDKSAQASPRLASLAVNEQLAEPALLGAMTGDVKRWVDQVLIRETTRPSIKHVGALSPATLTALEMRGSRPNSSVLNLASTAVKQAPGPLWEKMPALLRSAEVVLQAEDSLMYILRDPSHRYLCTATPSDVGFSLALPDAGVPLPEGKVSELKKLPVLSGAWHE